MSVFKRGDIYWTEFVYKGQRIRESTGTDKKKLAEEFEDKLRRELHEQVMLGRTKAMTFGEATDHYTTTNINIRRRNPDGTMRSGTKDDLGRIKRMEEYFGTDALLSQVIAPAKIAEYRKHLLATGIKPNSANRILNIFRAVLNAAFKAGGLAREPIIENFTANDARERFLSEDEEKRLLKACPAYLRNLVQFYLDTGARHDEGVKLTWDRVSLVKDGRSSVTFTNTKNGKARTVPLPSRTAAMLTRLRPKGLKKQSRVFLWKAPGAKKAVPFADPKKAWETARTAAKLDGLRIHDLRHTYASKLIKKRVPLYDVSKLMGHGSVRMTERYAHLVQEQLESAVAVLDQAA
ncbi:site-specific integrase [Dongia deserti]|uniref:site-specific integrase n=1 Tax=Dongia deserti TaxID=2268030 RepID=UPI000E64E13C|nr:site-specific integrase [Dongia deserti]